MAREDVEAATYVFLRAGLWATAWVAGRWSRQWGEIDTRRRRPS